MYLIFILILRKYYIALCICMYVSIITMFYTDARFVPNTVRSQSALV